MYLVELVEVHCGASDRGEMGHLRRLKIHIGSTFKIAGGSLGGG